MGVCEGESLIKIDEEKNGEFPVKDGKKYNSISSWNSIKAKVEGFFFFLTKDITSQEQREEKKQLQQNFGSWKAKGSVISILWILESWASCENDEKQTFMAL